MTIYTKLLEVQKQHLAFEKDAKNPFFKANYISLDSIVEKLTPILDEQKVLLVHFTESKEIVTQAIDTEDSSMVTSRFPLIESNDPQKLGSCITYAKRYNLGQIFNIITDRDDDGNEASGTDSKETKKEYPKTDDLPWYNNFEKDKDSMIDMIGEGKKTAQEILDGLKKKYKVNKEVQANILNLF